MDGPAMRLNGLVGESRNGNKLLYNLWPLLPLLDFHVFDHGNGHSLHVTAHSLFTWRMKEMRACCTEHKHFIYSQQVENMITESIQESDQVAGWREGDGQTESAPLSVCLLCQPLLKTTSSVRI